MTEATAMGGKVRMMARKPLRLVVLVCCIALQGGAAWAVELAAAVRLEHDQPPDVTIFLSRRVGCEHWAGEEGYDGPRRKQIADALRKLDCDHLDRDEARLRKRHLGSPYVLKALDQER